MSCSGVTLELSGCSILCSDYLHMGCWPRSGGNNSTYTVNPLYNDIRYNSKIRYNVNSVHTKISRSCIFSLIFP